MPEPKPETTEPQAASRTDRRGMFHDTWELELLISGALVFGLLQLPSRISDWWSSVSLYVEGDVRFGHFLAYYYVALIVYVLIFAFALHIASRAYWVGLIGLRSVFPEGPDWKQLESRGPIGLRLLREKTPSLDTAIRATDDFCSSIFAFATLVVGLLLISVAIAIPFGLLVWLLKSTLLPEANALLLGVGLFYLTMLPAAIGALIDRKKGAELDPDGTAARLIRMGTRYSYWLSLGPIAWPILNVFTTRVRRGVLLALVVTATAAVILTFGFDSIRRTRDTPLIESFSLFPESRTARTLDDAFYEDRREGVAGAGRTPYIQSDIVAGPYVRLFVPYYPQRDEELIAEICPDVLPLPDGTLLDRPSEPPPEQTEAALRCLADRFELSLDGTERTDLYWSYFRDPISGARGTVTYIDVRELDPGRHELRLVRRFTQEQEEEAREELAGADGDPEAVDPEALNRERTTWVIAFWR